MKQTLRQDLVADGIEQCRVNLAMRLLPYLLLVPAFPLLVRGQALSFSDVQFIRVFFQVRPLEQLEQHASSDQRPPSPSRPDQRA